MQDEESLIGYLEGGGRLNSPETVSARYRAELMRLMAVFVDSEMAGASGFADCINLAPGLRERRVAARIVLEKFSHAQAVLEVMEQFGAKSRMYVSAHPWAARLDRSTDLGTRRVESDMRLNVFHYPIYGWVDAVVMNLLMGRATNIQLGEFSRCSYQPLADAMQQILPVEDEHANLGLSGLRGALENGHDPTDAQASVNYWYPRVTHSFGKAGSDRFETYRRYGLREQSNEALLAQWRDHVDAELGALALHPATLAG